MRVGDAAPGDEVDASGLRVAVVTATFNAAITGGLEDGAIAWLADAGVADPTVVASPGAFELPLIAKKLTDAHDAVVALGAVVLGETDHYDHVAHRASEGLMRVSLDTGVPVAFGILTVRDVDHAMTRSAPGEHNKGAEAAEAAVRAALVLRSLGAPAVVDE